MPMLKSPMESIKMTQHKCSPFVILVISTVLVLPSIFCHPQQAQPQTGETQSKVSDPTQTHESDSSIPVPKFGEVPTNRVLPVDQLTDADYEDVEEEEQNEIIEGNESKDYCARLLRADLLKVLRRMRKPRQADDQEESLLASYLEFDPAKVTAPLLNILGSAMARNVTAIDEHYKQLPPLIKTEVTDVISIFAQLLKSFQE